MFLVTVTRNRRRGSTWVCPVCAVRVAAIFLTLMASKSKSSRLLVIFSAVVVFIRFSEFGEKVKEWTLIIST
jgi:hypothetical protein